MIHASRRQAIIINAICYSFYSLVLKAIATVDYATAVIVTLLTNIIGVYLSYCIMDKFTKEKLWRITATLKTAKEKEKCIEQLKKYNIGFTDIADSNAVDIYSYTQQESSIIKNILSNYKYKYFIQEMNKKL